jgi:hypothetical protein
MWQVLVWDAADNSLPPCNDMPYLALWGSYVMQDEAIQVASDLRAMGNVVFISYNAAQ